MDETGENVSVEEVTLLESLVVLDGDTEEKRGLDDIDEVLNLVEWSVDLDGDWEEIKCVEDSEVVV